MNKSFLGIILAVLVSETFALFMEGEFSSTPHSHHTELTSIAKQHPFEMSGGRLHFAGDKSQFENGLIFGKGNTQHPSIMFHPHTGEVQFIRDNNNLIHKLGVDENGGLKLSTHLSTDDHAYIRNRLAGKIPLSPIDISKSDSHFLHSDHQSLTGIALNLPARLAIADKPAPQIPLLGENAGALVLHETTPGSQIPPASASPQSSAASTAADPAIAPALPKRRVRFDTAADRSVIFDTTSPPSSLFKPGQVEAAPEVPSAPVAAGTTPALPSSSTSKSSSNLGKYAVMAATGAGALLLGSLIGKAASSNGGSSTTTSSQ